MEEEKYNLITQELLLAGYCAEHHPDYVVVPAGRCGASPLDNTDGGFVYNRKYLEKAVFVTGCGLSVRYRECIGRLDYIRYAKGSPKGKTKAKRKTPPADSKKSPDKRA